MQRRLTRVRCLCDALPDVHLNCVFASCEAWSCKKRNIQKYRNRNICNAWLFWWWLNAWWIGADWMITHTKLFVSSPHPRARHRREAQRTHAPLLSIKFQSYHVILYVGLVKHYQLCLDSQHKQIFTLFTSYCPSVYSRSTRSCSPEFFCLCTLMTVPVNHVL